MSEDQAELTILMPCLNEAETLERCVNKARRFLDQHCVAGEVLVADNGSTDGSQDIARRAGARVVDVPEKGYGAALRGGIRAAHGRYIIMGDADDSYDFLALAPFLERLRQGDELVMGNRFRGGIAPGAMPPLHRYLGNPVLSFLGRLLFRIPVGDFHCGMRGFSKEAITKLNLTSSGMEFASEMVVQSRLRHLRISEVPTTLSPDGRSRAPHLRTWRDGWRHLRFLLLYNPRWLFFYPGLSLLLLGLVGILGLLWGPIIVAERIELSTNTLLVSNFSVLIGVQLGSFAVLARQYAASTGLLPSIQTVPSLIEALTLERLLLLSGVILLVGLGGVVWSVWYWAELSFGNILDTDVFRFLSISLTLIALSVQLAATALFAAVFQTGGDPSVRD